jgi:large subunit ribosomal protein L2
MAIVKTKPTSPGRRFVVKVINHDLHKGDPYEPLLEKKTRSGGRNNNGHITTRHLGGGHKQHYRIVDFKRNKDGIPGKIERIEYDPNRTAYIALVVYLDGERRYMIAPKGASIGEKVQSGCECTNQSGQCTTIKKYASWKHCPLCRTKAG